MVSCKGIFVSEQVCSVKGSNVSSRLRRFSMQIQAKLANIFRTTLFFLKLRDRYLFRAGDVLTPLAFETLRLHGREGHCGTLLTCSRPGLEQSPAQPRSAHQNPPALAAGSLQGAHTCPPETGLRPDLCPPGPTDVSPRGAHGCLKAGPNWFSFSLRAT